MNLISKKLICMLAAASLLLSGCASGAGIASAQPAESTRTGSTENSTACTAENIASGPAEKTLSSAEGMEAHGEEGYLIEDGMAQPVLTYSNFRADDYSNQTSDIQRFCVYVETDHDTDNDGLADLVKVFAQVPTAAVCGYYQAGAIYDPTPYGVGTADNYDFRKTADYYNTGFDYDLLYKDCEKRPDAEEISTLDLAFSQDSYEWNYTVPATGSTGFTYATIYDYYLVRGYAVVECSGIGTLGSQGYELCGTDLEAECHKCVIEWLTGSRKAYSDVYGTYEVKADWCNGKTAMTGCSYGGTLPFEVATLGVEGLETIIPFAGIANWYDYTNSQGTTMYYDGRYMDFLASFNSGSLFLDDNWTVINPDYASWLEQIASDQDEANGNYTEIWQASDFTRNAADIQCSALIVQGLNDFNVTAKQADSMVKAFKTAGQNVKLVLHQDGHNFLDGITVGDDVWQNIMNRWLSHYLLDVDNGIENMAEVTYQSNVDGKFYTADSWGDFDYSKVEAGYDTPYSLVTSEGYQDTANAWAADHGSDINSIDSDISNEFYASIPDGQATTYVLDLAEGETVYGVPTVSFTASPTVSDLNGLTITAVLVDVMEDGSAFPAYNTKAVLSNTLPVKSTAYFDAEAGYGYMTTKDYVKSYTRVKAISFGWMDLANPGCGNSSADYSTDTSIVAGESYEYTFYMLPTVYTLEPGHTLKLILTTYDALRASLVDDEYYVDYGYSIDNSTLDVEIPTLQK